MDDELERLGNLLGAAALAIHDLVQAACSELTGMTGETSAALLTVATRPDRNIEHLRRTLELSHSGTVRLVDRLEDRGWIAREVVEGRREVTLRPTSAGQALADDLLAARRGALHRVLAPVPTEDRESLSRSLTSLLRALPRSRADAWRICRLCEHGVCRGRTCPVGSAIGQTDPAPAPQV